MRHLVAGSWAALLLLAVAAPAGAQEAPPQMVSSDPEEGATVHKAPQRVEVEFDQPLDDSSSLAVVDECDNQLDDGSTEVDGNTMSIGIVEFPSGGYHVEYLARGVEGLTGENEGHFTFTVHAGKACDGKSDHHHNDDDKKNGHDDHKKNGHDQKGHENDHDDHDMDDGMGTDHTDHTAAGTTHTDHNSNDKHGGGKHDKHARHEDEDRDNDTATGAVPGITSSDTARRLLERADSGALIAALALCAVVGILGGAILRSSARPRAG